MECEEPVDHGGNATAQQELGHGCVKVSRGLRARDRGQGGTRGGAASGPAEAEPPPPPSSAGRRTATWTTRGCSAGRWMASSAPSRGASCAAASPASGRSRHRLQGARHPPGGAAPPAAGSGRALTAPHPVSFPL